MQVASISLPPVLEGRSGTVRIANASPAGAADRRAAALARWGGRLWMAAVLTGVLLVILAAALVAPLRALLAE
jgi:hypothetical protein